MGGLRVVIHQLVKLDSSMAIGGCSTHPDPMGPWDPNLRFNKNTIKKQKEAKRRRDIGERG